MAFVLVDRRKSNKGKSSNNRQKLLNRVRGYIKDSLPVNVDVGGVTGKSSARNSSPVAVIGNSLEEPSFRYKNYGNVTHILPGNDRFNRGDALDGEGEGEGEGGGNGAGSGGEGEDDIIIHVSRDEFLNVFFEGCELPNLTNEKTTDKLDNKLERAGYSTTGTPASLSVIKSYEKSIGRRLALKSGFDEDIAELQKQIDQLLNGRKLSELSVMEQDQILELQAQIEGLSAMFDSMDNFDSVDLRYKKREAKPLKTVDAVLIMVMDISASMTPEHKKIARRWFALLYAFIKRKYAGCELIFIAHTTEPFEMKEEDFFSTRKNGGTEVTPTLQYINKMIMARYDPDHTNIFISHASDGDNYEMDNTSLPKQMLGGSGLLSKIQFFTYVEVGTGNPWSISTRDTALWESYNECRLKHPVKDKMVLCPIEAADDVYDVFKSIFKKRK